MAKIDITKKEREWLLEWCMTVKKRIEKFFDGSGMTRGKTEEAENDIKILKSLIDKLNKDR